ncbi:YtxH domain-containing protein [Actinomadura flavalba]|uniref:YtxH domain-containing protein n=1 Tax=Actinomadura flavalba TaxID=1120938 RepID=UPI0003653B71|nr:YtxH domain-containing protein [Actinomadura flavalba]
MKLRAGFFVGAAVGYVLGTKAGRERYEQIKQAGQRFSENPAVKEKAEVLKARGTDLAGTAKVKAEGLADTAKEKLPEKVPGSAKKDGLAADPNSVASTPPVPPAAR